jgi:hypothetical protein
LRKFAELAFDEAAELRWQESRPAEADNMDVGPATRTVMLTCVQGHFIWDSN